MFIESKLHEMRPREASTSDISKLAVHHRKMFMEIWENKGDHLDPERANEIEKAYVTKLEIEMKNGNCIAWVIEDKERVVASGAVTFISLVPNPSDLSSKVAYLHSMYTEKAYRNRKCTQKIIQKVINLCASQGIKRIMLNASDAGQPVYQKIGFTSAPDTMRLFIG